MSDAIPASVRKAIDNADNAYEDLCLHGGSQTEADNADRLRDEAILAALTTARQAGRDEERERCADRVMLLYQREGATHVRVDFLDAYANSIAIIEVPDAPWPELGEPTTPPTPETL